jgi:site-specific DNA-cytosine methylase
MPPRKPRVADLFCGMGGFSRGAELAGGRMVLAADAWDKALESHGQNFRSCEQRRVDFASAEDRAALARDLAGKVDLVIGGPPCQQFSTINNRRGGSDLPVRFMEVAVAAGPRDIVMEEVRQFKHEGDLAAVVAAAERGGYRVGHAVINAKNVGVPQSRARFFLWATRDPARDPQAEMDLLAAVRRPEVPIKTIVWDPSYGEALLAKQTIIDRVENRASFNFKSGIGYKQMDVEKPCPTLTRYFRKASSWYVFRDPAGAMRLFNADHGLAAQGYPRDWKISGTKLDRDTQIGNSVPVKLGEAVLRAVLGRSTPGRPRGRKP